MSDDRLWKLFREISGNAYSISQEIDTNTILAAILVKLMEIEDALKRIDP